MDQYMLVVTSQLYSMPTLVLTMAVSDFGLTAPARQSWLAVLPISVGLDMQLQQAVRSAV